MLGISICKLQFLLIVKRKTIKMNKSMLSSLASFCGTLFIVFLSSAARGDLAMFIFISYKYLNHSTDVVMNNSNEAGPSCPELYKAFEYAYLYILISFVVSFSVFLAIGEYFYRNYYVQQRENAAEWKCQAEKFPTKELEKREFRLGCINLCIGSILSGLLTTYLINGGCMSTMYFDISNKGWVYFIASTVGLFWYQNAILYYAHRLLHHPLLYKHIHKYHHQFYTPTAYSALAFHPFEFVLFQFLLICPLLAVSLHYMSFVGCVSYIYYYGMVDHSGVDLSSIWPWQPEVRFHDDHHKYFHVNFGFNLTIFDRIHGTMRVKNRIYGEDIFEWKN